MLTMNRQQLILSLQEEYSLSRFTGCNITGEPFEYLFAILSRGWQKHHNIEALYRSGWLLLSRDKDDKNCWQIVKTAALLGHPAAALDMFLKDFEPSTLSFAPASLHWLKEAAIGGDPLSAKWYILLADADKLMPERSVMEVAVQTLEQETENSNE